MIATHHGIKTPDGLGLFCVLDGLPPAGLPPEQFWPVNDTVPEGMVRTGWQLVAGVVQPVLEALPSPVAFVPEEVPTWALREVCAATVRDGQSVTLHAEIEAAIAALPEPNRAIALNRWEYKPTMRRQDAVTLALIALLGLTEVAADDLFVAAQART